MSRAQREMAQPPVGHETIVSMVITITHPEIHFWGSLAQQVGRQNTTF
ncbi:MAG: hypothetical protein KME32_32515 [Mojavia pulchra JT2-VF2]|uniref:Uncharacterized protein n=1 Tax=Mojavia pulchra JT2-VF2 TaxID=287848 RepID=A0A951Q7U6_9NOST|nr:hypothetical protein [Mojavia pulchra JT2-VF2]